NSNTLTNILMCLFTCASATTITPAPHWAAAVITTAEITKWITTTNKIVIQTSGGCPHATTPTVLVAPKKSLLWNYSWWTPTHSLVSTKIKTPNSPGLNMASHNSAGCATKYVTVTPIGKLL